MDKRIQYIDGIKAFAMILVILGHCQWLSALPSSFGRFIYSFHMPLFFIISGFFIKPISIRDGLKKYGVLYLKPYFFTCIFVLLIDVVVRICRNDDVLYGIKRDVLRAVFASGWAKDGAWLSSTPYIGPIWFLFALFWACLLYSILKKHFDLFTQFVIVLLLFVLSCISVKYIRLPFSIQAGASATLFLFIGGMIRKYNIVEQFESSAALLKLVLLLLWCYCVIFGGKMIMSICQYDDALVNVFIAVAASLFVLSLFKRFNVSGGWLGRSTLFVLCGHQLPLRSLINIQLDFNPIVNLTVEFVLMMTLALSSGFLLSKCPFFFHSKRF